MSLYAVFITALLCVSGQLCQAQAQIFGVSETVLYPGREGAVVGAYKACLQTTPQCVCDEDETVPTELSLVVKDEGLIAAVDVNVSLSAGTLLYWNVKTNLKTFPQKPVNISEDTDGVISLVVEDESEDESEDNIVSFAKAGNNEIWVEVSLNFTNGKMENEKVKVYTIGGFLTLFPILLIVVLAMLCKNIYIAMFFGIWVGTLIALQGDFTQSFKDTLEKHILGALTSSGNQYVILFTLFLSGFFALVTRSGGQIGFAKWAAKYATTNRRAQLAAACAGILLFFDDYTNALVVGKSFKTVTDALGVSREKLAFIVDSTSAPIASVVPLSSWIGFELGLIDDELQKIHALYPDTSQDLTDSSFNFFIDTIPSRFYPFFMIFMQFTLIIGLVEFGPMLVAERRVRIFKRTDGGDGADETQELDDLTAPEKDTPAWACNFFIPLGVFIIMLLSSMVNIGIQYAVEDGEDPDNLSARVIFGNTDPFAALVYASFGGALFSAFWYMFQVKQGGRMVMPSFKTVFDAVNCCTSASDKMIAKMKKDDSLSLDELDEEHRKKPLISFVDSADTFVEGVKNITPAVVILVLAFSIKTVITDVGTDRFFADVIVNGSASAESLPTIVFIISGLMAWCTGTSWGTMSIMFPIVSIAAWEKTQGDVNLYTLTMSQILAGAIFGDHSSLISDTTILSSIGSGCKVSAHVYTQFPYAGWGALFAILLGTLPAGYGMDVVAALIVGGVLLIVCTILVSAPVVAADGRYDVFTELVLKCVQWKEMQKLKAATREFATNNPSEVTLDCMRPLCKCWEEPETEFDPEEPEGEVENESKLKKKSNVDVAEEPVGEVEKKKSNVDVAES